jgi:hypothetical protein
MGKSCGRRLGGRVFKADVNRSAGFQRRSDLNVPRKAIGRPSNQKMSAVQQTSLMATVTDKKTFLLFTEAGFRAT